MKGEAAILKFKKLSPKAFAPVRSSDGAAGYDLRSAQKLIIPAKARALCLTDIQISLPSGCYGRIAPRSGLSLRNGIDVGGGVIDEDYRGNIGIILFNHSESDFEINEGDRIAQLICEKIYYPKLVEVMELNDTQRGCEGFGSTGIK